MKHTTSQEVKLPMSRFVPSEPAKESPETIGDSMPKVDEPFDGYSCSEY